MRNFKVPLFALILASAFLLVGTAFGQSVFTPNGSCPAYEKNLPGFWMSGHDYLGSNHWDAFGYKVLIISDFTNDSIPEIVVTAY